LKKYIELTQRKIAWCRSLTIVIVLMEYCNLDHQRDVRIILKRIVVKCDLRFLGEMKCLAILPESRFQLIILVLGLSLTGILILCSVCMHIASSGHNKISY
jgi:hypothetical protein